MSFIIDHEKALEFVKKQDRISNSPDVIYHNIDLIDKHIELAQHIVQQENIDKVTASKIYTAIAFLYTGYRQEKDLSLEKSRAITRRYLHDTEVEQTVIDEVIQLMTMAEETVLPVSEEEKTILPVTQAEGVISDILHAYLGEKKLISILNKKWTEKNLVNNKSTDFLDLLEREYAIIKKYRYRSDTGFKLFDQRRRKNLNKLYLQINVYHENNELQNNKAALTMLKTEIRNQVDLISIADQKAGLMISINALLLTILLPVFASYLVDMSQFLVPAMILLFTCGAGIILATLTTRPGKMKGKLRESNISSGKRSVLSFYNFYEMSRDDYYNAIVQNMSRDKAFESSIINHIYDFGQVLGEKYKRLRLTYNVFAFGIILTIITLAICLVVPMGL